MPLLIIMKTVFAAAGKPDIAGFLFEHGTLTHVGDPDEEEAEDARRKWSRPWLTPPSPSPRSPATPKTRV